MRGVDNYCTHDLHRKIGFLIVPKYLKYPRWTLVTVQRGRVGWIGWHLVCEDLISHTPGGGGGGGV